jgi:prepilin-type N-terminal cleavage/methylation domain-containing protein
MIRHAFSLIEMLLALTVMVAMTTAIAAYVCYPQNSIKGQACSLTQSEVQLRVEEYFRAQGRWPSSDLRELGNVGWTVPRCPIDGQPYRLDPTSGDVITHIHSNP